MALIASTVFSKGRIHSIIVSCTEQEYTDYMEDHDKINENQISATFLKEYLNTKGLNFESLIENTWKDALACSIGYWRYAKTLTVADLKEILHEAKLYLDTFIDAYAEYLKTL